MSSGEPDLAASAGLMMVPARQELWLARPPRDQVRDDTLAFPPAARQQVHLPPRHPQLRRIRRLPPTMSSRAGRADHLRGGRPGSAPSRARPEPALSNRHRLVSHPRNLTVAHRRMGQTDASADDCGSAGCPVLSALTRKPDGRSCKEPRTSTIVRCSGVSGRRSPYGRRDLGWVVLRGPAVLTRPPWLRRVPLPWRARRRCTRSACGPGQPGGGDRCQPGLPPWADAPDGCRAAR